MYISTRHMVKNAALVIFASCSLLGFTARGQQKVADNSTLSIERNPVDKTPKSIVFSQSAGWKAGQAKEIFQKYLGVDGVNTTMELKYSAKASNKSSAITDRYTQYVKGIKVEYGTFTLSSKNGYVLFATGNYYDVNPAISSTPGITEGIAFGYALDYVHADKYMWQDAKSEQFIKARYHNADTSYLPHGQLEWVEDYINGATDRQLHLAYAFDIYAQKPTSRQLVFVDAHTGKILHSNSIIKHTATTVRTLYSQYVPIQTANTGGTYVLYDSTRGSGVYTVDAQNGTTTGGAVDFTSATNVWPPTSNDTAALDAQWGAEMVYDYWNTQHSRLSWNGTDGQLLQFVHWDVGMDNAFWDGSEMCYGDGTGCAGGGFTPLTSIDVTGHEIGHGVCQATANLTYSGESGALNEGFSDCWGASIENWSNPHEIDAVAKQPWEIGEELGCGTAIRSMDNPELHGQPSVYNFGLWQPAVPGCTTDATSDYCGVHQNNSILTHWYYLVTMGGIGTNVAGTAYNVNAIGWTESSDILYATELALASNATYADCRTTSINQAIFLYGSCSPEVQSVTNAWYAVGVGTAFVPCSAQIGFVNTILDTTEYAATTTCPASKVINIGLQATGAAISGGSPVATVVVGHGTAVAGVDYILSAPSVTFTPGDISVHNVTLTLYDNGAVNDDKNLALGINLATAGSTAVVSATNDSMFINITNDDFVPETGLRPEWHILTYDVPADSVTSNVTSSFYGGSKRSRSQFLLYASELTNAGVRAGVPINQIAFKVLIKNTTIPFTNYTVQMANTATADLSTAFVGGLTTVYTGNYTTNVGVDSINFTTPFTWDGTSNLAVQVCFGTNSATGGNDQVVGVLHTTTVFDRASTNTGAGDGCGLGYNSANQNNARPWVRFKQIVPPSGIETILASTRTWNVKSGTEVYFYNPSDTNVIAGVMNQTNDLGCVSATITAAGNGLTPASFSPLNRSIKEVTITPTTTGSTSYDVTMYMTTAELAASVPSSLYLLKTDAATDATVNASNTVIVTPTLITGTTYSGFQGHFSVTGSSRFFLVDGPALCTPPVATITAGGPTTFCLGGNVNLNATTGASYTYQWQLAGANITGATNANYTATTGGAYTVVISETGCTGTSAATNITVDSAYAAPLAGATTVCTGQTATLTDITTGGVWHSADNTKATINTSGVMTGVAAGSVLMSYTVTNACGTATSSTLVTVNTSPVVTAISSAPTLCAGSTIAFTDATGAGVWSSGATGTATVDAAGNVTGVSAGSVTITYGVTSASCTTNATASLTVLAQPAAIITPAGSTTFCTGGSVVLNANTGSGLTYQWQSGGIDITGATTASYTATTTDNIDVIVTNTNNCATTSSIVTTTESGTFVVVPAVAIAATPGTTVCTGSGSVSFTATPVNGGTSPVYSWSVNGTTVAAGSTISYVPADGDVVSVVLTSNAPCASPDTAVASVGMTVSSFVNPSVSISTVNGDTACAAMPTTFVAVPVYGGTTPSYLWTKNGINVATGATYTFVPASGDVIFCTMTSNFPCRLQDTAVSSTHTMVIETPVANTVTVTPSSTSIVSGATVTFTANAPNAGTSPVYQWFLNSTAIAGATSATYVTDTLVNGQIVKCQVISSEPCAAPHINISSGVTVLVTTGIDQVANTNSFVLVPNPNKGTFVIKGTIGTSDDQIAIRITDVLGQVVYTQTLHAHNEQINQTITLDGSLANGMYIVNIASATGTAVYHMVLDK